MKTYFYSFSYKAGYTNGYGDGFFDAKSLTRQTINDIHTAVSRIIPDSIICILNIIELEDNDTLEGLKLDDM